MFRLAAVICKLLKILKEKSGLRWKLNSVGASTMFQSQKRISSTFVSENTLGALDCRLASQSSG